MSRSLLLVILAVSCLLSPTTFCRAFSAAAASTAPSGLRVGRPIPITVLSGFLGSGKTTLLRHLLQNNDGLKIGVIVNDVASVNIDEKLVVGGTVANSSTSPTASNAKPEDVIQLSNGCACCSLSDELLASVSELITISDLRDPTDRFDHIVIETSGVSDPKAIRGHFQDAMFYNMPLMERVRLDTMCTVVDCTTYLEYLKSAKSTTEKDSPELHFRNEEERERAREANWIDYLPATLAEALGEEGQESSPVAPGDGTGVSELLVEQTEVADVVLLNKIDILQEEKEADARLREIESIVKSLNPRASIIKTKYAAVDSLEDILGAAGGNGVVEAGIVDDHRDYVSAASGGVGTGREESAKSHQHSHTHSHSGDEAACTNPNCTDPSHRHDGKAKDSALTTTCTDPDCNDPMHTHDHSKNDHDTLSYAGIGSFVYRARRPFHPGRLTALLRHFPIVRGVPGCNESQESTQPSVASIDITSLTIDSLKRIIRSKGFTWLADSNLAAMYWSHAGSSFELQCLGRWWATLPREQWPEEAKDDILSDFDDANHNEKDASMSTVGDRRQEVVFIGPKLSDANVQDRIRGALDQCLLADDEWISYKEHCSNEAELRAAFTSPLPARMLSY